MKENNVLVRIESNEINRVPPFYIVPTQCAVVSAVHQRATESLSYRGNYLTPVSILGLAGGQLRPSDEEIDSKRLSSSRHQLHVLRVGIEPFVPLGGREILSDLSAPVRGILREINVLKVEEGECLDLKSCRMA